MYLHIWIPGVCVDVLKFVGIGSIWQNWMKYGCQNAWNSTGFCHLFQVRLSMVFGNDITWSLWKDFSMSDLRYLCLLEVYSGLNQGWRNRGGPLDNVQPLKWKLDQTNLLLFSYLDRSLFKETMYDRAKIDFTMSIPLSVISSPWYWKCYVLLCLGFMTYSLPLLKILVHERIKLPRVGNHVICNVQWSKQGLLVKNLRLLLLYNHINMLHYFIDKRHLFNMEKKTPMYYTITSLDYYFCI